MQHRIQSRTLAAVVVCSLATAVAGAAPPNPELADLRREVADMRREISDMRREIYALRLDLLSAIGQLGSGHPVSPKPADEAKSAPPALAPPVAEDTKAKAGEEPSSGRVQGVVRLEGDARAAYVYVENVPWRVARNKSITIKQANRQFDPRWAVVQLGTTINFPNEDAVYHNVFSLSSGNTFDLGIYRAGEPAKSYTTTNPGILDIYCNMHSEMSSSVLVVPSPLYVQVGKDGRFALDQVPKGSRKLVAWSPGHQLAVQTINVQGGRDNAVSFNLSAKSGAHTNKHGQPYGSYR